MSAADSTLDPAAAVVDPRAALRVATVALGVTGALWRAGAVMGAADASWPVVVAGGLLAALQLAWAVWLALRPSRRVFAIGALMAGGLVTVAAGTIASGMAMAFDPSHAIGFAVESVLALACLAGASQTSAARTLRTVTGAGLVTGAVALSALVGGATHAHATTDAAAPARGDAPGFVCRLV